MGKLTEFDRNRIERIRDYQQYEMVGAGSDAAFMLALIDRLAQEAEPQTCATCRWCRESDKTNRLFCFVNGPESEFETFKDEYCSGYERKEATHGE